MFLFVCKSAVAMSGANPSHGTTFGPCKAGQEDAETRVMVRNDRWVVLCTGTPRRQSVRQKLGTALRFLCRRARQACPRNPSWILPLLRLYWWSIVHTQSQLSLSSNAGKKQKRLCPLKTFCSGALSWQEQNVKSSSCEGVRNCRACRRGSCRRGHNSGG